MRKDGFLPLAMLALLATTAACSQPVPGASEDPAVGDAYQVQQRGDRDRNDRGDRDGFRDRDRDDRRDRDRDDRDRRREGRRSIIVTPYFQYPYYTPNIIPYRGVDYGLAQVAIRSYQYLPETINVAVGGTVTWYNQDVVAHTVTHPLPGEVSTVGAFDGVLPVGGSYSFTFNAPGVFEYYCRFHPTMRGVVRVGG